MTRLKTFMGTTQELSQLEADPFIKIRTFLLEKFCSDPVLAYEQLIRRKLI